MYTILFKSEDKSLQATVRTKIYQRESLVDKFRFLIPQTYNDVDLSDFAVVLKYLDQGNEAQTEILTREDELYKDYYSYILPVDTNLTRFAGDITLHLTMSKVDMEEMKEYSLETGETTITISPLSDYYHFTSNKTFDVITQKVNELNVKLEAMDKMAATYDAAKADNIKLDTESSELYLTSNGKAIGDKISLNDLGDEIADTTEDGLIKVVL